MTIGACETRERHVHAVVFDEPDADYVVLLKHTRDHEYAECARWMIPGTQIED